MRISDWSSDVCSSDLRVVGKIGGHQRTRFDTGGGVADDVFETHFLQVVDDLFHAFLRQRIFVARLRGGQDEQVFKQIGRASCRARVGQYVYITVVAVSLTKQNKINTQTEE